jgi:hypothetical protein
MERPRFRERHPLGARMLIACYAVLVVGVFAVAAVVAAKISSDSPSSAAPATLPRPNVTTVQVGPVSASPEATPTGAPTAKASATHKAKSATGSKAQSGSSSSSGSAPASTAGTAKTITRPTVFPSGGWIRGPFPTTGFTGRPGPGGW